MPDRYDPRLSLRPGGDRKPADTRQGAVNDPLAELAKIVAGRPTTAQQRQRSNGTPDPATSPGGGDVLGDLEAELLNDLQASFAAVRDMVPPPPPQSQPAPAARQAPPQAAPEPPPPPPQYQQRMPEPQERAPEPPPMRAERSYPQPQLPPTTEDREPEELAEMFAPLPPDPEPEPAPLPPRMSERSAARQAPPRLVPVAPVQREAEVPPPAPERPARATRLPSAEKPDLGAFQMRATNAPPAPPPAQPSGRPTQHSRWEKPDAGRAAAGSRFAPPRQAVAPPAKAPVEDDLDMFGDDDLFAAPVDEVGKAEDFPLEGFGETEAFDDEPPHYQEDLASMMEPRRPRGLILAGVVIAVILAGGVAVAMFRPGGGSGTETPPVIVADGEPTKITPDQTADEDDPSSKLIYDRVDSGEETAAGTALESGTEPLAALPTDDAGDNPITRVIIPGGPGIDAPADEGLSLDGQPSTIPEDVAGMQAANESEAAFDTSGPRRVRTVIVKPDGTIVESAAAEEGTAEAPPTVAAAAPPAAAPEPVQPAPITDDTAAISGNGELAITPVPDADFGAAPADTASAPEPLPLAPAAPAPAAVAAAEQTQPLDLSQPEPAVAAAPTAASGMLVQVSSQRSEDAARATYRDLQERYPGILGSFEPNIQRADIPDRGTFFRVRVGPFSSGDAQRLCDDLKSAGGDCILAQR